MSRQMENVFDRTIIIHSVPSNYYFFPVLFDTHPNKKGPVMKNYTRHLTSFSMVIYQAEHDLWCPINVGWENIAQWLIFQVK